MLLNIVKLIIIFIQTINQSICVDLNHITHADIQTLEREFPNIMKITLQNHPYYIKSNNGVMVCPIPYSQAVDNEEVPYKGILIENEILENVVNECVNNHFYTLAYIIILNAIESMGFTYMYRFCEFAIEMNKKRANIFDELEDFSEHLEELILIFNRELFSPEPYECILEVYKKHKHNHKKYKFKKVDRKYRKDLLSCMKLMKDKVHFLAEPRVESINTMSINELEEYSDNNNKVLRNGLSLWSQISNYKYVIGDKNQSFCGRCNRLCSGMVDTIFIFVPCGHGWCCDLCYSLVKKCPVCHQDITNYLTVQPKCVLHRREARCISCFKKIQNMNPPNKHVMSPCGHGWYCSKCIDNANCTECNLIIKDKLRVKLLNNE
ncbi:uncharacterized protein LOC126894368 isoform X2 [Daktulosphaira vitifoliae]|uniref:uncharacterized protein LOC126894368 isoform X2 n=1 Tax=Daktulosphaira vitifoliae TaxID=58002 RepID=UPI0021AA1A5C|nr:uncharacterized protein LOC126894368 isoform X2 [Daktulosphaira vitifoliae]